MDLTTDNDLRLPERIRRLESLAYNLWWCWNPEARYLFRRIDRFVWERVEENPVLFLYQVDPERLQWASFDAEFLRTYDEVMTRFDKYLDSGIRPGSRNTHQILPANRPPTFPLNSDSTDHFPSIPAVWASLLAITSRKPAIWVFLWSRFRCFIVRAT